MKRVQQEVPKYLMMTFVQNDLSGNYFSIFILFLPIVTFVLVDRRECGDYMTCQWTINCYRDGLGTLR